MEDAALSTKLVCLVLFGVISLSCGLLPLLASRVARRWRRRRSDKTEVRVSGRFRVLLSCVLCLGGGVLLGTVFTHMLPEIRDIFLQIEGAGLLPGMQAPAGEIFVCAGFFLVYLVEELVHAFLAGRASAKKRRDVAPAPVVTSPSAVVVEVYGDRDAMSWHERYVEPAPPPVAAAVAIATADAAGHDHASGGHDHGSVVATLHALRAYIVIVALSVHSVFEGFAVAFETTSRDVWVLFAAIATHKAIVAFCLGEQLLATKRSVCFVVTNLLILSAASPLGVTIGLAVEQLEQDESSRLLCTGVLQALAAGTILYVVFFEILAPERQKHGAGLLKFFAVVTGFVLIVLMHSSGGHSHGGPARGLAAGVHGHGGHGETPEQAHDHGHGASEPVNSDYLARVPNESGHVYDTVRYIKSFSRQKAPTVDPGDIVAGMRSIVEDLDSGLSHGEHGEHGDEGHEGHEGHGRSLKVAVAGTTASGAVAAREDSGHHHAEEASGQQPEAQPQKERHPDDLGEHDDHHENHVEPSSSGDGEPRANAEEGVVEEDAHHHHDHDQFMRTVADMAGQLGGLDQKAVDRTVSMIDTLDLIAMQKTEIAHRACNDLGKDADGPSSRDDQSASDHDHDHDHDLDHDQGHKQDQGQDHDHDHGQAGEKQSSSRSAVPAERSGSVVVGPSRDGERRWLHGAHFGEPVHNNVQFVLQDTSTERSTAPGSKPVPAASPSPSTSASTSTGSTRIPSTSIPSTSMSSTNQSQPDPSQHLMEAERELQDMVEVRFHEREGHVDEERTHAPALRSPTSTQPVTVT